MFIVFEGIDGAGTGAQTEAVAAALTKQGRPVDAQEFPDHHFAIYKHLLHPALHGEIELDPDEFFLLFLTDQLRFRTKISPFLKSPDRFFIADRYFTTNLVYNCAFPKLDDRLKGPLSGSGQYFYIDQGLELARQLQLAVPDLTIFLEVSPQLAVQRKQHEQGHDEGLDRYERSVETQEIINARYRHLIKEAVFCRWTVVKGEGSLEEVTGRIIETIKKTLSRTDWV